MRFGVPYKLRRMLGKIVHEGESFIVSKSMTGDGLEVIEKSTRRVQEATAAQRVHLKKCLEALRAMNVETTPGSKPFETLVDDFASAVFRCGMRVERAFFTTSPRSRAYSAVVRTQIDDASKVDDSVWQDDWEPHP